MMEFLTARRGPLLFITIYVAGFLVFIAQEASAWVDAIAKQEGTRAELAGLKSHADTNVPATKSGEVEGFSAASETQAIASFDAFVRSTIASLGGVVVSSRTEQADSASGASSANSIMISTIFEGNIELVQSALYKLETGSPPLFIDKVSMDPVNVEGSSNNPVLRVSMSLSSQWSATR
jgi:hypothetical protein